MAQIIDTSVLITLERQGRPLDLLMTAARTPDEPLALAAITVSELLAGVYRADSNERRRQREDFAEAIFATMAVLPFDTRVARTHARVWAELVDSGRTVGANDLLIAATALTHGYDVLTENPRDFERVPGLVVLQPNR